MRPRAYNDFDVHHGSSAWAGPVGGGVIAAACALAAAPLVPLGAAAVIAGRWAVLSHLAGIGRRAYSLYLWDWPRTALLGPIAALPAVLLVAEISYRFVERPIVRAVHRGASPDIILRGARAGRPA